MPSFVAPCIGDIVQLRRDIKLHHFWPTSDKQSRILVGAGFAQQGELGRLRLLTLPTGTVLKIAHIEIRKGSRIQRESNVVGVVIQPPSPAAGATIHGINIDVLDGAKLLKRGRPLYEGEVDDAAVAAAADNSSAAAADVLTD